MPSTDTVTAKLTPGEFVIKKSAVDILGVPLLRKLNNLPDEGGHDNIDKLLSMAALEDAKPMMGGGVTTPNGVMGYENGGLTIRRGEMSPTDPQYQNVEYNLPVRRNEYGEPVMSSNYQAEWLRPYVEGLRGAADENNMYKDALQKFNKLSWEGYGDPLGAVAEWHKRVDPEGQFKEGNMTDEVLFRKLKRADKNLESVADRSERKMQEMIYSANREQLNRMNFDSMAERASDPSKKFRKASKNYSDILQQIMQRPIAHENWNEGIDMDEVDKISSFRDKVFGEYSPDSKVMNRYTYPNFQNGGMIGYQEGEVVQDDAMMQQYLQHQQMQQQQPQQQGQQQPSIAPPGAAAGQTMSWGEPGAYMNSLTATRDSLYQAAEQAKIDSANQSLEAIKLDSLIQSLGGEGELIEKNPKPFGIYGEQQSAAQDSEARNRDEYMKQQIMQRFFEQNR